MLALGALAACGQIEPGADRAATRAAAYLWSRQAEDGGWHSETYGLLRSGQSLTPFVLHTLLEVPEGRRAAPAGAVQRAASFVTRHTVEGCVGVADPGTADYPNYATALAVCALRAADPADPALDAWLAHLRGQQLDERGGFAADHPAHGGFGMGGARRTAPHHGHLDLSMTRHVLQALLPTPESALGSRALRFLERCQNPDGGFVFCPAIPGVNKAVGEDGGFASYGSTTADGILALAALGVPGTDPRVARATAWLRDHHRVDRTPGFADAAAEGWAEGLRFYYLAASARAFAAVGLDEAPAGRDWRRELRAALRAVQRGDGSWRNPNALVKEDDPLIATCLALQAWAASGDP